VWIIRSFFVSGEKKGGEGKGRGVAGGVGREGGGWREGRKNGARGKWGRREGEGQAQ